MDPEIDLLISNGTCYWGKNHKAPSNVIPCGNTANAQYACCIGGDHCLENNVCWNEAHDTTYMVGCTDVDYGSSACPHKDAFQDQIIVGMVRCGVSDDKSAKKELWAGCPGDKTRTTLGAPDVCTCTDRVSQGLFHQAPSIPGVASLPKTTGGTIEFELGHWPSTSNSATATASSTKMTLDISATFVPTLTPTGGIPSNTAASTTSNQNDASDTLSSGEKAGIALGSIVGAGITGAIIFLGIVVLRRYRAPQREPQPPSQEAPTSPHPQPPRYSGETILRSQSGYKSELPGDSQLQELSGSSPILESSYHGKSEPQYQRLNSYREPSASSLSSSGDEYARSLPLSPLGPGGLPGTSVAGIGVPATIPEI